MKRFALVLLVSVAMVRCTRTKPDTQSKTQPESRITVRDEEFASMSPADHLAKATDLLTVAVNKRAMDQTEADQFFSHLDAIPEKTPQTPQARRLRTIFANWKRLSDETALAKLCRGAISEQWENDNDKETVLGKYTFKTDENGSWLSWPWSGNATGNGKVWQHRAVTFCHFGVDWDGFETLTGGNEKDAPEWWQLSPAQVTSNEGQKTGILKSGLPEKCRSFVRSSAELRNFVSIDFDDWSQEFTKEDSHFVIWRINFTAKNHFNADIPYTATCTVDEEFEFYGNILRR